MKTPLLAAVLLPLTALAHPWSPPPEPFAPAPAPVAQGRVPAPGGDRADDVRDLWSIDSTLAQLDQAAATRDLRLLRWVDGRARGLLGAELRKTRREAERARLVGDGWRLRHAGWKLAQVARLEHGYRTAAWRLDPWSVARRRAILVDLDRVNRQELAAR